MNVVSSKLAERQSKPVKQRLIDAGERLFAEHGWNGVGIRTIAAAANVSLAALNYHFGEKENLLAEIFAARARPIAEERMRLLAEINASGEPSLERVIEAFLRPALTVDSESRFGGIVFAKLRARLATEPEAFSRRILADAFDASGRHYIAALQALLPDLQPEDLFWRFHFLLGTMVYTMADPGRIQSMSDGRCKPGNVEAALRHIVPFLAAGFRAPAPAKPVRRKQSKMQRSRGG
ncbi:MAG: TetR/AcrR family transcriptional regulator [Beijerinckiaceae bacterium]